MAFDPDSYLAKKIVKEPNQKPEGFDPDKYLTKRQPPKEKQPSVGMGETALESFGQALTFGHLPELQAATAPYMAKAYDFLTGENVSEDLPQYEQLREENIARQQRQMQERPYTAAAGTLGGVAATIPLGGAALRGAGLVGKAAPTMLGRARQAATAGAAFGALQKPMDTESEGLLAPEQRAIQALQGGLMGGAFQGGGEMLGRGLRGLGRLPQKLREVGGTRAAAATGLSKAEARRAIRRALPGRGAKDLADMGNFAVEKGIVQVGDDIEAIAQKAANYRNKVGKDLGAIYRSVSDMASDPQILKNASKSQINKLADTAFKPMQMSDDFLNQFRSQVKGSPQSKAMTRAAERLAKEFQDLGPDADLLTVNKFRQQLDDVIFDAEQAFAKAGTKSPSTQAFKELRSFLKKKIDDRIETLGSVAGKEFKKQLQTLNKEYQMASNVHNTAKNRLAGDLGNNFLSLTDKMALFGGAGLGVGSAIEEGDPSQMIARGLLGAGAGLASKGFRTYGRPAMAIGASRAGGLLQPVVPRRALESAGRAVQRAPVAAGLLGGRTQGE